MQVPGDTSWSPSSISRVKSQPLWNSCTTWTTQDTKTTSNDARSIFGRDCLMHLLTIQAEKWISTLVDSYILFLLTSVTFPHYHFKFQGTGLKDLTLIYWWYLNMRVFHKLFTAYWTVCKLPCLLTTHDCYQAISELARKHTGYIVAPSVAR